MCPLLFVTCFLKKILKTYAAIQIYSLWAVKAPMFFWKEIKCQISHSTIFLPIHITEIFLLYQPFLIKRKGLGHTVLLGMFLLHLCRVFWEMHAVKLMTCGMLRWVPLDHCHSNSLSFSFLTQGHLSASPSFPVAQASISWLTAAGWKGRDVFVVLLSKWDRQILDGSWHQGSSL